MMMMRMNELDYVTVITLDGNGDDFLFRITPLVTLT